MKLTGGCQMTAFYTGDVMASRFYYQNVGADFIIKMKNFVT